MNAQLHTSPAVLLAHYCLQRIKKPEIKTAGALEFTKTNREEEIANGSRETKTGKNIYKLPDGTLCTLKEAAAALQASETYTCTLFSKYKSRYAIIYKNHGPDKQGSKYKLPDGTQSSLQSIVKLYGFSESTVSKAWLDCKNDYKAAHKIMKYKASRRALLKVKGAK